MSSKTFLKSPHSSRLNLQLLSLLPLLCFILANLLNCTLQVAETFAHNVPAEEKATLNEDELKWLKEHPVIRVAPDPDFPPVEYLDNNGGYRGIAADFISLIENKIPIKFEIVALRNWDECIKQAKSREIDMFGAAVATPGRLEYLRFTKPFVEFPAVILVRDKMEIPPTVTNLEGLRVAVVSNYAAHEYMRENYPDLDLVVMPDISTGLRQVSLGRVDAMVLNLASASYYIEKEGITNLRVYKDSGFIYDLSFATRSDWPILNQILQKAVNSITETERKQIISPWLSLQASPAWRPSKQTLIIIGILCAAGIFAMVLVWNAALRKRVTQQTEELQKELFDRKKAEKEKEQLLQKIHRAKKMEALGMLAGGVAHDLNNILSGLISYPELLLLEIPEGNPQRELVHAIKESGDRAAAVVADLLTIARGAASTKQVVCLNDVIIAHLKSPEHGKITSNFPQITIDTQLEESLLNINCSTIHLKKVLLNLVLNALEAIKTQGEITISTANIYLDLPLKGYEELMTGEYVCLSVADNGPGIDSQELDRIFEPFYSSKFLGRSGTGLGLAIVWNTLQDHQGYINVKSTSAGTTFDLYFPVSREKAKELLPQIHIDELKGSGEKILVIDDESSQRTIACKILGSLNYQVEAVSSGEEAIRYLKDNTADLLLLDMIMEPGINGRQAYEEIRKIHPTQKAIIASGFAETTEVKLTQAEGAGVFIKKPYSLEQLGLAVQEELKR